MDVPDESPTISAAIILGRAINIHLSLAVVSYGHGESTTRTMMVLPCWGLCTKLMNNNSSLVNATLTFFSKVDLLSKSISDTVFVLSLMATSH